MSCSYVVDRAHLIMKIACISTMHSASTLPTTMWCHTASAGVSQAVDAVHVNCPIFQCQHFVTVDACLPCAYNVALPYLSHLTSLLDLYSALLEWFHNKSWPFYSRLVHTYCRCLFILFVLTHCIWMQCPAVIAFLLALSFTCNAMLCHNFIPYCMHVIYQCMKQILEYISTAKCSLIHVPSLLSLRSELLYTSSMVTCCMLCPDDL